MTWQTEINDLWSFAWQGTKKHRFTKDKWGDIKNCRKLKDSHATANALLTGRKQLDPTKQYKLIAVDLDKKDNWNEVITTFKALNLPQTLTVATPSGGYHLFYWVQKELPARNINDDTHCKSFELKGDNGNITAPGSVFTCGATYRVVRDLPIAKLDFEQTIQLCKHKPLPPTNYFPATYYDQIDLTTVENEAYHIDERARRNPRGWQIRCPYHNDHHASAILFDNGWFYCSGCGKVTKIIRKP